MACQPNELTNITPPYSTGSNFQHWLETGADEPPETAAVHLLPRQATSIAVERQEHAWRETAIRKIAIPEDTEVVPLIAPAPDRSGIKIHECIALFPSTTIPLLTRLGDLPLTD